MVQGRWRVAALAAVAAVVLAACANSSTSTPGNGGSQSGSTGGGGQIGTTKISGVGTVLDNPQGLTLYHLTSEKNGQFQCTGSCTSTWPPYLTLGGTAPTGASSLTGPIATISRPDGGMQVTYQGFPLYTFSGDSGPGQANGDSLKLGSGVWWAVTPTGDASGSGGGSGGRYSGGSGGGYGYGGS